MQPSLTRRTALLGTAGAAALACSGLRAKATAAPLQIIGPWEITGLQPTRGYIFTRMQVTETLVEALDNGTLVPGLATRWSLSPDRLEWRFELRPGARFHDGTPLRAEHVVRCLRLARIAPALLSVAPIDGIDAIGDRAVVIRLSSAYATLPALLAHHSTMVLAPSSFEGGDHVRRIVGTGPYRIVVLEHPQKIETARFEQYDGPRPAVERVRYLAVSRFETRALMAEAGQADLTYQLDPSSLQRLRSRPQLTTLRQTLPRTLIVKLNCGRPSFADLRVRQAMSLAIDRAGIAQALLRDPEMAAGQLFSPVMATWHDPALPPLAQDRAQAMRLLDAAGWKRQPDGVRAKDGHRMQYTLVTYADRPELPLMATALQEQWRQIGVAVKVSVGNSGDIPLGHRDGTLDIALIARSFAQVPDPTQTLVGDFPPEGADWGAMHWHDDRLDTALAELARGADSPARTLALHRQVAASLHAGLPVIPVAWYRQQLVQGPRIADVSIDPLERSYRLSAITWKPQP